LSNLGGAKVFKRVILSAASLTFIASLSLGFSPVNASANKVDCGKVMSELGAGKKSKDIAKEMNISTTSVYRCKKKVGTSAKTSDMKTTAVAKPMATASPMHK
jgi:hypothetical protein